MRNSEEEAAVSESFQICGFGASGLVKQNFPNSRFPLLETSWQLQFLSFCTARKAVVGAVSLSLFLHCWKGRSRRSLSLSLWTAGRVAVVSISLSA